MTTPYQVPTRIRATKNCAANATPAHALLPLSQCPRCAPALWPAGAARVADGQATGAHGRHANMAAEVGPSCPGSRPARRASTRQALLSRLRKGMGAAGAGAGAGAHPRRRTGACASGAPRAGSRARAAAASCPRSAPGWPRRTAPCGCRTGPARSWPGRARGGAGCLRGGARGRPCQAPAGGSCTASGVEPGPRRGGRPAGVMWPWQAQRTAGAPVPG